MINPPITGNNELDSYLYELHLNGTDSGMVSTGNLDPTTGEPVGYTYQYIHVKYADDNTGTGMTDTPTYKMYWGIFNSTSSTESTNPADYTWYKSPSGFGTTTFLYYLILGGRQIKFALNTSAPDYKWKQENIVAIDLDSIVPLSTISYNELMNAAVTELKLAAGAVTASKTNIAALDQATGGLKPLTVSAVQIMNNAVTELKILDGAVSAAKTNVAALSPLTGYLNNNTVDTAQIVNNAVTNLKVLDGAITATKTNLAAIESTTGNLTANSVGATQIAPDSVTSQKIVANAIVAGKIAANAVTANTIEAGSITAVKLAADSVTANAIAANSVVAGKIAANAVVASNIQAGTITGDKIYAGTITGDLVAANAIGANQIAANAITAVKIEAGAIIADKIAADAVTSDKITAGAVTALKITAGAVTADKIAANTITANKMVTGTITAASGVIADAAITSAKIGDAEIGTLKVAGNAITAVAGGDVTGLSNGGGAGAFTIAVQLPAFSTSPVGAGKILISQQQSMDISAGAIYDPQNRHYAALAFYARAIGGNTGTATIAFQKSTNGGGSWSDVRTISATGGGTSLYLQWGNIVDTVTPGDTVIYRWFISSPNPPNSGDIAAINSFTYSLTELKR